MDEGAGTPPEFEFQLIGTIQAFHHGARVELRGPLARAVLAVLLLHVVRPCPRPPSSNASGPTTPASGTEVLRSVRPAAFRADVAPQLVDVYATSWVLLAGADRDGHEPLLAVEHLRRALGLWAPGATALADTEPSWLRPRPGC